MIRGVVRRGVVREFWSIPRNTGLENVLLFGKSKPNGHSLVLFFLVVH